MFLYCRISFFQDIKLLLGKGLIHEILRELLFGINFKVSDSGNHIVSWQYFISRVNSLVRLKA